MQHSPVVLVLLGLCLLGLLGWGLASSWSRVKPTLLSQAQPRPTLISTPSAAVAAATPVPVATRTPTPVPTPVTPTVTPTPLPTLSEPARANVTAPVTPSTGRFTLQIGAYQNASEAEENVTRLQSLGLDARVRSVELPGKGTWHRVQVGRFPTRVTAVQRGQQLQAQKAITGFLVTDY